MFRCRARLVQQLLLVCVVVLGGLAWGCGSDAPPETDTPISIRLGLALQPNSVLLLVARDHGFFEQEGLDVSITTYPSGKRALKDGLLKGEVDIINSTEVPVALESYKSLDLRILASIGTADSIQAVIARKDAGITTPADLAGKRVGTQKGSAVHFYWHLFHLLYGIEEKKLDFMKAEQLPAALVEGRLDAFSMREPFIGIAKRQLGENSVIFSSTGVYVSEEILATTQAFAKGHPEAIARFLRALIRAEEVVRDNPEDVFELVIKNLEADPDEMRKIWPRLKQKVALDQSLLLTLEEIGTFAEEQGIALENTHVDFSRIIDAAPLERVSAKRVTLIR